MCHRLVRTSLSAIALLLAAFTALEAEEPAKKRKGKNADSIIKELLASAPVADAFSAIPVEDLAKVPEIRLATPLPPDTTFTEERAFLYRRVTGIMTLNLKDAHAFQRALLAHRSDLQGLPFIFGDEAMRPISVSEVFRELASIAYKNNWDTDSFRTFYELARVTETQKSTKLMTVVSPELHHATATRVLMHLLAAESMDKRIGLAKFLETVPHVDATRALVKLALYSKEPEVRLAAVRGLRLRRERDYTLELLDAFDYPHPAIAKHAADAIVHLKRDDLTAALIDVLDRPDPRTPHAAKDQGQESWTVRELVRINYHHNCLLCHTPNSIPGRIDRITINTPFTTKELVDPFANRGHDFPESWGKDVTSVEWVETDVTYLRPDFSRKLPVADSGNWPELQRFEFVVRTRPITTVEADLRRKALSESRRAGGISLYHAAALFALRELTKRDAEPTGAAWRNLLQSDR